MKISGVKYGEVISIDDEKGGDRISVRIHPEDNDKSDEELEVTAFPFMPKMIHVKPKVGEGVLVLFATWNDAYTQRYYIGPVISQPHRMGYDPYFMGGDTYQKGAPKAWDANPLNDENAFGAYPEDDDISIVGRKNCDIQIKEDDIRIRAGVKLVKPGNSVKFNRENSAFIKLKYYDKPIDIVNQNRLRGDQVQSTATIVADKINLFSNRSTEVPLEDTSEGVTKDLITDKKLKSVMEEAYSLPYGEKLVKLLKEMIEVFNTHTHDFIGLTPDEAFVAKMKEISLEPLEKGKLLSGTVKIN